MTSIKKAVLHGAGDLRIEEELYDTSSLKSREIFVRTLATAFSTGTDLGNYDGRSEEVPGAPGYPRSVGYSNAGIVEAVGSAVKSFRPGERVFSTKPHRSAYIAEEHDLLVRIPDKVDAEEATLAYLTHLGLSALRQVNYQPGEDIAVVGLGVIGLCTIAVARTIGARVTGVANDPKRAEIARELGAQTTYVSGSFNASAVFEGRGADVVVLTANTWDAYYDSMEMARRGGRVSILGFPGRAQPTPQFNPLEMRWLYGKQLTIVGAGHIPRVDCPPSEIRFNLHRNLEFVLDRMADRALCLTPVISHRFPYTRMREAYELARSHSKELTAAVFDWSREPVT
jgi:threonine dehydrogenase-like Zn-dependent dehydrogenase